MSREIELGDKVRDKVTGVTGIVVAMTNWLFGCSRIGIQPQELKDGKPVEQTWIDILQAELVEENAIEKDSREEKTGGPQNEDPGRSREA